MGWILFEALLALALALFMVWWTMRSPRKRDDSRQAGDEES